MLYFIFGFLALWFIIKLFSSSDGATNLDTLSEQGVKDFFSNTPYNKMKFITSKYSVESYFDDNDCEIRLTVKRKLDGEVIFYGAG